MINKIEISYKTILFTIFVLGAIWFVSQIRDIILLIFIAFIITSAMRPMVDFLVAKRFPRFFSVLILYIIVFGVIGVSLAGTIPSLIVQSTRLIQSLPSFIGRIMPYWNIDINSMSNQIAPIGENIVKMTVNVFSDLITTFAVIMFSFYFLLERNNLESVLEGFVGKESSVEAITVIRKIEDRLGAWVLGQLVLMFFIGLLVFIGLSVLKIDYALSLAIIAGMLEIIPNIGPVISAIPAVIIALATSPVLAVTVVIVYIIIHQLEGNFLVPMVMKKSVGLSPVITIISMLIGGKLAGISGIILAVPIVLVLQELLSFYFEKVKR